MNTGKKYNANALMITVIISLVIFMLMSAVVALAFYHRSNEQRTQHELTARNNLYSAINFVLGDTGVQAKLPEDVFTGVTIERTTWGLCQFAAVRAVSGHSMQQKAFLYGAPLPASFNACLYLVDHGRPLSITGKTVLTGDVYLPTAGYIGQIPGNVKFSNANLPQMNLPQLEHSTPNSSLVPNSLTQSFFSPAYTIYRKKTIILSNTILKGRIIIKSDSAIIVDSRCTLDNIILISPSITFRKGFSGRVQAFASKEIISADDCSFSYPSCLVGSTQLGRNCKLEGMLISANEASIQQGTIITGVVYVNGQISLEGKVNGIVLTDFFVSRTATTEYQNFLTDVEINRNNLSQWFISPPIFTPSSPRNIMQWLE